MKATEQGRWEPDVRPMTTGANGAEPLRSSPTPRDGSNKKGPAVTPGPLLRGRLNTRLVFGRGRDRPALLTGRSRVIKPVARIHCLKRMGPAWLART
jgi:hypothetical protein